MRFFILNNVIIVYQSNSFKRAKIRRMAAY